jgi:hypothetical protein
MAKAKGSWWTRILRALLFTMSVICCLLSVGVCTRLEQNLSFSMAFLISFVELPVAFFWVMILGGTVYFLGILLVDELKKWKSPPNDAVKK